MTLDGPRSAIPASANHIFPRTSIPTSNAAATTAAATVIGLALSFTPISPIQMLIWSAVINGVVAVPIMAVMMLLATNRTAMGRFHIGRRLALVGWAGTGLMALTVAALFWSMLWT